MYLIYINVLNRDWEGYNLYEFIFSDTKESEKIEGEDWNIIPASNNPTPPSTENVKEVGSLRTEVEIETVQQSSIFSMYDAIDGVIAIGWEKIEDLEVYPDPRLIFNYGEGIEDVKNKLYARDLILDFKIEEENSDTE